MITWEACLDSLCQKNCQEITVEVVESDTNLFVKFLIHA